MSDAVRFQEVFELLIEFFRELHFFMHLIRIAFGNCCRNVAGTMIDWNLPHIFELTKEIASVAQRFVVFLLFFFSMCEQNWMLLFLFVHIFGVKITQNPSISFEPCGIGSGDCIAAKIQEDHQINGKITSREMYIESNRIESDWYGMWKACFQELHPSKQSCQHHQSFSRKVIRKNLHIFFFLSGLFSFIFDCFTFSDWFVLITTFVHMFFVASFHFHRWFLFHSFAQHTKDAEMQREKDELID